MSVVGQTEKNSVRAHVFRVTPESGHGAMRPARRKRANKLHDGLCLYDKRISERYPRLTSQGEYHAQDKGVRP